MTASRDPDRLIHDFLFEGEEQLHDQVYDAVRAEIEHKRQRAVVGPWRFPEMNKFLAVGLGAAAVVVALLVGAQLLGSPDGGVGAEPTPTATPDPTPEPTPSEAAWIGIPEGPYVVTGTQDPVQVTFDIASPGWSAFPEVDGVSKADDGLDPPDTVGAALLAWSWAAGTEFNVYGDPCLWSTTIPETTATTPDEIAAAFAAQEATNAFEPADITVGGYVGKAVTLHVPAEYDLPNSTREERFADCDRAIFGFYGITGGTEPERNAQGADQIDELWILDVEGSIVILDATYGPLASPDVIEEMRTMAESATLEAP